MNSVVCIDASLALKLVFEERDSDRAQQLWDAWQRRRMMIIAPSLWAYEVTSVVRKRAQRGRLPADFEQATFRVLHDLPLRLLRPAGLHQHALDLARRFDRPAAYDAHYLALADMVGCPFWTADERLVSSVRDELEWVHWLGDDEAGV